VVIALVGNVFSPYYRRACQRAWVAPNPWEFAAFNLALYGPMQRWIYTERAAEPHPQMFQLGNNRICWKSPEILQLSCHDTTVPWQQHVRGEIEIHFAPPSAESSRYAHKIDKAGNHLWWPVSPYGQASVDLRHPKLSFSGTAYHDMNYGVRALADDFWGWHWQRERHHEHNYTDIHYRVLGRDHSSYHHAYRYHDLGKTEPLLAQAPKVFGRSKWGLQQWGSRLQGIKKHTVLEDSPFYTRTLLTKSHQQHIMHEQLSLRRFEQPWVQKLIPYRLRRR
jgi:carotenoid 1,2-hydratase